MTAIRPALSIGPEFPKPGAGHTTLLILPRIPLVVKRIILILHSINTQSGLISYLFPLSYISPKALGALLFLLKKIRSRRVIIYGDVLI